MFRDGPPQSGIEILLRSDATQGITAFDNPLFFDNVCGFALLLPLVCWMILIFLKHAFGCRAHRRSVFHEKRILVIQFLNHAFEEHAQSTPRQFTDRRSMHGFRDKRKVV